MDKNKEAREIMGERFGKDTVISIATVDNGRPFVRNVDAYYEGGMFYVVTYALSSKMKQIQANPEVAICGEWFTGHGIGESVGHVHDKQNLAIMEKLREAFAAWYSNGHVNEEDPNTCILRIRLTDGVLFSDGRRYALDFARQV